MTAKELEILCCAGMHCLCAVLGILLYDITLRDSSPYLWCFYLFMYITSMILSSDNYSTFK